MKKKNGNKNIKLTIKNVRCFSSEQHFNIKPLTFLVGENSTGKTTVMGCFNIIGNLINGHNRNLFNTLDFNSKPYLMGSFEDIVTKKSKSISDKNKQKEVFEIGCDLEGFNCKYDFQFAEKEKGAEPVVQKANMNFKNMILNFDNKILTITDKTKKEENVIKTSFKGFDNRIIYDFIEDPYYLLYHFIRNKNTIKNNQKQIKIIKNIEKMFKNRYGKNDLRSIFHENIVSLSPLRSKPKRTYDPIREVPDPEGSEIPVILMKLSNVEKDWKHIHKKLVQFGKTSGLFSDVKVKKYGKSIGEPFQLQFQVRDFKSNIMDIGYGVSQLLPLLVRLFYPQKKDFHGFEILLDNFPNRFLLQQPEVHLHPRAQAEFTSLLIENIKNNKSFLIETHSDYMLDRTSIEIRKKKISPDDVSLIYLEPTKQGVKAHNMSFDEEGNLKGAPQGYRDFFTKESNRFLGFED